MYNCQSQKGIWCLRVSRFIFNPNFVVTWIPFKTGGYLLDMAKRVRNFWPDSTRPEKYLTQTRFFLLEAKTGWPVTRPVFFCESSRPDPQSKPNPNHFFLTFFFWVKKRIKLRQYCFNCLLWALRKQLIHLHNCMQINWKINACG